MTRSFEIPGLANQLNPAPGYVSGGQPTPAQLEAATEAGIGCVINLRPATENAGFDESAAAARLGLAYTVLGIAGPQDLTPDNARQFDHLLAQTQDVPTLVHCASGNRVGALMALRAGWVQGKRSDEALAVGRRWGMTSLETTVRQLLATH